jgi:hypothetical protein
LPRSQRRDHGPGRREALVSLVSDLCRGPPRCTRARATAGRTRTDHSARMSAIPRRPFNFEANIGGLTRPHGRHITRQGDVASVSAVISSNLVLGCRRAVLGSVALAGFIARGSSGAALIWVWLFRWCWLVASRSGRGCRPRVPGVPFRARRPRGWRPYGFVPPAGRAGLNVRYDTYPDATSACQKLPVLRRAGCGIPRSVRGPWSGNPVDDREVTYSWSPEPRVIADPGPELSRG